MGCTVVVTQPTYLPWLGYFEQLARANKYVFLDTVQFEKQSWQCRNRLKSHRNEIFWLTVPLAPHALQTPINQVRISPTQNKWKKKHLSSIRASLGAAPFFADVFPRVEAWLQADYEWLTDLNIAGIRLFAEMLGLQPQFVRASELNPVGSKTEMLVSLCRELGATRYYSSLGSKVYIDEALFDANGIELVYQTWSHPVYQQRSEPFVSHLAVVDVLMNIGSEATGSFLHS
jgi:hypothetical protein